MIFENKEDSKYTAGTQSSLYLVLLAAFENQHLEIICHQTIY